MADNLEVVGLEFDTRQFEAAIRRAERHLDDLENSIDQSGAAARRAEASYRVTTGALDKLGAELTKARSLMGLLAGATGMGFAAKSVFELGASVEETGSKFRTVFGGEAGRDVQAFVDSFATKAGLSNERAQALTSSLGGLNQAMGASARESGQFAIQATRIAADLASFHNAAGGAEEVLGAMKSALVGEFEPMKRFDVLLNVATVSQRAMAMTGKDTAAALTQQEKATATLALITERAGVAIGDLDRTSGSAANQAKALGAELQTLREGMASGLLPAMGAGVTGMNKFIKGLQIMGAESAVTVAKIELEFAKLGEGGGVKGFLAKITGLGEGAGLFDPLGLDLFSKAIGADLGKSVVEAEAHLARIEAAADAVMFDIVGLTAALAGDGSGGGDGGGGGQSGLAPAISEVGFRAAEAGQFLTFDFSEGLRAAAAAAEDMVQTVEDVEEEIKQLTESQQIFADNVVGAFDDIQSGTADVAEAFSVMVQSIIQDLARAELRRGLEALLLGEGEGFGWQSILTIGAGIFAGGFADGGTIPSGQFGLVGERGPELISGPATITPRTSTQQVIHYQTVNLNLSAIDSRDARRFLAENRGEIAKLMRQTASESSF